MLHSPSIKNNMRNKFLLLMLACMTIICSACSSAGYMSFAHQNSEDQPAQTPKKIICINHVYAISGGGKKSAMDAVAQFEKKNQRFTELLTFNAQKAGVNLSMVDGYHLKAYDQDYF